MWGGQAPRQRVLMWTRDVDGFAAGPHGPWEMPAVQPGCRGGAGPRVTLLGPGASPWWGEGARAGRPEEATALEGGGGGETGGRVTGPGLVPTSRVTLGKPPPHPGPSAHTRTGSPSRPPPQAWSRAPRADRLTDDRHPRCQSASRHCPLEARAPPSPTCPPFGLLGARSEQQRRHLLGAPNGGLPPPAAPQRRRPRRESWQGIPGARRGKEQASEHSPGHARAGLSRPGVGRSQPAGRRPQQVLLLLPSPPPRAGLEPRLRAVPEPSGLCPPAGPQPQRARRGGGEGQPGRGHSCPEPRAGARAAGRLRGQSGTHSGLTAGP